MVLVFIPVGVIVVTVVCKNYSIRIGTKYRRKLLLLLLWLLCVMLRMLMHSTMIMTLEKVTAALLFVFVVLIHSCCCTSIVRREGGASSIQQPTEAILLLARDPYFCKSITMLNFKKSLTSNRKRWLVFIASRNEIRIKRDRRKKNVLNTRELKQTNTPVISH